MNSSGRAGAAGYYDVYFEVLDNQGNRNVSSVMRREVFYSEAPEFEFQPASHASSFCTGG